MAFGEAPGGGDNGGGESLSIDELEVEITTLAAHLSAATYRLLVLIEEFDRRGGWVGWGVRSCAHWLSWKAGIGLVAAREKVRVARALASLPLVTAGMRAGRLSYSKVRALTRIAGAHNERALLSIAENGTASHVETVVRLYRRTDPDRERQRLSEQAGAVAQFEERGLSYFWDHDGCLVVQGRLPPEQGALLVKALEAADEALRADARGVAAGAGLPKRSDDDSAEELAGARDDNAQDDSAEELAAARDDKPRDDSAEDLSATLDDRAQGDSAEDSRELVREARSWQCRQGDALGLMAETLLARGRVAWRRARGIW
jgi:hypothetical protein